MQRFKLINTYVIIGQLCVLYIGRGSLEKSQSKAGQHNLSDASGVDDILRETIMLLDVLDQKLINVNNRTQDAMMKDNLRSLESPISNLNDELAGDKLRQPKRARDAKPGQTVGDDSSLAGNESNDRHVKLTLDLMKAIFAAQQLGPKANSLESFLVSPLSIQTVLMMMHLGARGQTRRELASCLHLGGSSGAQVVADSNQEVTSASSPLSNLKRRHPVGANDKQQSQASLAPGKPGPLGSSATNSGASTTTSTTSTTATATSTTTTTGSAASTLGGAAAVSTTRPQLAWQSPQAAHELFGCAVKNLLKDPIVMKSLTSANQVFLQKNLPLSSQFEWAIKNYYQADVKLVDFRDSSSQALHNNNNSSLPASSLNVTQSHDDSNQASVSDNVQQMINEWVEKQTRGRISNLLTSPVPSSTLMMAINALYFKGDWQFKFDPSDTDNDAIFTHADGKTSKVPMMVSKLPLAFAHDANMRTSVIELPYKAQRLGLFLLLPDETAGIFHTMQMLNSSSFANLISSMRKPTASANLASNAVDLSSSGINVRIPKFSIESSPRMSQILTQQLGLKTLFSPDVADLSGMFAGNKSKATSNGKANQQLDSQQTPLQVGLDELLHKAILQVDEQGSSAAASSATIVERVGLFNNNYFEADHPFLLFLMDKQTGLVLFSGVYAGDNNKPELSAVATSHKSYRVNRNHQ